MFEGLDEIDWSELTHAYGPAQDVPELLRGLVSPDAEVRREALNELFGNIYHQGSRYEASAYAVPFLVELAVDPETRERHQVLRLLSSLAVGDAYRFAATGFPLTELREAAEQVPVSTRQRWLARLKQWYAGDMRSQPCPLSTTELRQLEKVDELAAYDAVAAGVPSLIPLLDSGDAEVAGEAIYALAWFPAQAALLVPPLVQLAADDGQPLEIASAALIALGLVSPPGTHDLDALLGAHLAGEEPILRWAAAVTWARVAGEAVPAGAVEELRAWAVRPEVRRTVWNVTRPRHALEMLDRIAVPVARQVRGQLVSAALAQPPDSNWHNHILEVLGLAFAEDDPDSGLAFDELTPAQQTVIRWLIDNPNVFDDRRPSGPLRRRGLPDTHAGLVSYAEGFVVT